MAKEKDSVNKPNRKVFISFLGTTGYTVCNYYFDDDVQNRVCNVRHVQEAIVRHECGAWTEKDKAMIFLTDKARKTNWESGKFGEKETDDKTNPPIKAGDDKWGLQKQLLKWAEEKGLPESVIEDVNLPNEGFSEEEIWGLFNTIENKVEKGDEIYFDFTSGFRSLPMLGIVLLTYLKNTKDIAIGEIYYGAFEKMGPAALVKTTPVDDRNAPVLRLKSFSDIMDFSNAANVFVKFGNGRLLHEHITKWAIENRKNKIKQEFTYKIQTLGNTLKKLTDNLQTCRGGEICYEGNQVNGGIFNQLSEWFEDYESNAYQDNEFKALRPLLKNIQEKYEAFHTENSYQNGLIAAKWCFDNQMYQQSITFLQESLVTYYTEKVGLHPEIEEERAVIEYKLKNLVERQNDTPLNSDVPPKWICKFDTMIQKRKERFAESAEHGRPVPDMVLAKYDYDEQKCEYFKSQIDQIPESVQNLYQKITESRNDMNHAGFLKNIEFVSGKESRKADSVIKSLSNFFKELDINKPKTYIDTIETEECKKEDC